LYFRIASPILNLAVSRILRLARFTMPLNFNAEQDCYELECDTSKILVSNNSPDLLGGVEKFRILIVGRTGVGKSTLVSAVFGIPPGKV
jgi:predicted GTPase